MSSPKIAIPTIFTIYGYNSKSWNPDWVCATIEIPEMMIALGRCMIDEGFAKYYTMSDISDVIIEKKFDLIAEWLWFYIRRDALKCYNASDDCCSHCNYGCYCDVVYCLNDIFISSNLSRLILNYADISCDKSYSMNFGSQFVHYVCRNCPDYSIGKARVLLRIISEKIIPEPDGDS